MVRDILRLLGAGPAGESRGRRRRPTRIRGGAPGGPGDDCALIGWGSDILLATSDVVTPRTHVPTEDPWIWGWHAAAVNLSDVAAKGGEPLGILVSLLLPPGTDESVALGIMKGARDCCARNATVVLGGDTKEGAEIAISGTALGRVSRKELMPRGGARPGDLLAVTGELGASAAGYLFLTGGRLMDAPGGGLRGRAGRIAQRQELAGVMGGRATGQKLVGVVGGRAQRQELAGVVGGGEAGREFIAGRVRRILLSRAPARTVTRPEEAVARFLAPVPRLSGGRAAARTGRVHACTDLSDGLSASVHQLCEASGTGAEIELERLPVAPVLYESGRDMASALSRREWPPRPHGRVSTRGPRPYLTHSPEELALHFGGDYELLMAIPPGDWDEVRRAVLPTGTAITPIGRVTDGRRVLLLDRGRRRPLRYGGWEHFIIVRRAMGLDGGGRGERER